MKSIKATSKSPDVIYIVWKVRHLKNGYERWHKHEIFVNEDEAITCCDNLFKKEGFNCSMIIKSKKNNIAGWYYDPETYPPEVHTDE